MLISDTNNFGTWVGIRTALSFMNLRRSHCCIIVRQDNFSKPYLGPRRKTVRPYRVLHRDIGLRRLLDHAGGVIIDLGQSGGRGKRKRKEEKERREEKRRRERKK